MVQLLLESRAQHDKATAEGATALHVAALQGHAEVVRSLLEETGGWQMGGEVKGEVESGRGKGWVGLMVWLWLAVGRWLCPVGFPPLPQAGAEKDSATREERFTPLHLACHRGSLETVQLLLDAGVDKDTTLSNGHLEWFLVVFSFFCGL